MAKKSKSKVDINFIDVHLENGTILRVDYRNDRVFTIQQHILEIVPSVAQPVNLSDFIRMCDDIMQARSQGRAQPSTAPDPLEHERPDPAVF